MTLRVWTGGSASQPATTPRTMPTIATCRALASSASRLARDGVIGAAVIRLPSSA